jgi:hypothetical protein
MIRTIIDWWRRRKYEAYREWARVPPPNWRCSKGGREYW